MKKKIFLLPLLLLFLTTTPLTAQHSSSPEPVPLPKLMKRFMTEPVLADSTNGMQMYEVRLSSKGKWEHTDRPGRTGQGFYLVFMDHRPTPAEWAALPHAVREFRLTRGGTIRLPSGQKITVPTPFAFLCLRR